MINLSDLIIVRLMEKISLLQKSKNKIAKKELHKLRNFKTIINKVIYKIKESEKIITEEDFNKAKIAYEKYKKISF